VPDKERAVVTGANRGIGLEVCRQLARSGRAVVLASREAASGEAAAAALRKEGLDVEALPLDVVDPASVEAFRGELSRRFGRIDALVNNAGVALDGFNAEVARKTAAVNFFGAADVTRALLPLIAPGGRVVMVSSGVGELDGLDARLRRRFEDPALSEEALAALVQGFVDVVRAGTHTREGWPSSAYRVSKIGLNALTRILAARLSPSGILVNAVCPGWVRTRMGGQGAPRGVEEGADTITWAATLPPKGPSGKFFRDHREIPW
jgi:NAD(P)-dependent dehydrogenase (short-subunit alcohol dehydrogenase family)